MGVLYVPLISCKIFINATKISGGIMKNKYKITFTKQELDRIWFVFNCESRDYKQNIKDGLSDYKGCLIETKLVLKKLKPFYKKGE